ncbi:MAG: aromatic amino acid ammonia-lyase, partial [Patescibacteria group bacterium]|nr:aromatic amino acid ammonia-lyase [Patescibacteria group bacterium]
QAVDFRGGKTMLSPRTGKLYEYIRSHVSYVREERPLAPDIELIAGIIESGSMNDVIRKEIFIDYHRYEE